MFLDHLLDLCVEEMDVLKSLINEHFHIDLHDRGFWNPLSHQSLLASQKNRTFSTPPNPRENLDDRTPYPGHHLLLKKRPRDNFSV
jgi:hypothetical protein